MNIKKQFVQGAMIAALAFMGMVSTVAVHADEGEIVVEGQGAVAAQVEATGPQDTDIATAPGSYTFPKVYVSSPANGNVQGWGYADEDIMLLDTGTNSWSRAFDGSAAGLPAAADIDAVATIINSGYVSFLMSFEKPTAVPGLGTVDDSDVVRYDTFNGNWSMYLDGSTVGLTTTAENVDALTFSPGGFLAISTTGNVSVKNLGGGTLKAKDEDLILLVDKNTAEFTLWLKGTTIGLQATNDLRAASFMPVNDSLVDSARYIVAQAAFTLTGGTAIGANDVAEQTWFKSGYTSYTKRLDASSLGFPKIDAIEVVK